MLDKLEYEFVPVMIVFALLTIVITALRSFQLLGLMQLLQNKSRYFLLVSAAVLLGTGAWLVHFLLITSFKLYDVTIYYHIPIVFAAWVFPVLISLMLLITLQSQMPNWIKIATSCTAVLLLTSTMHMTGNIGMIIEGGFQIDKYSVMRTILIPIFFSILCMYWLVSKEQSTRNRLITSLCFAFSLVSLELSLIYATTIDASRVINASNATMIPRDYLGQLILFCTFLFLFFIFMIVPAAMRIFRKYHTLMSLNERDEDHCRSHIDKFLTQFISLLSVPIAVINDAGKMTCFSESFRRLFQLDDNDEHTWELQQFLQKSHYTDLMQSGHAHEQVMISDAPLILTNGVSAKADIIGTPIYNEAVYGTLVIVEFHNINQKPSSERLTKRELEVYELLRLGMSNKEIAEDLHISENTVKNHVYSIFTKMNISDRNQLLDNTLDGN